jgi:glyoxalase/bleomycin resistance protein/dioxygenase superfamily protein
MRKFARPFPNASPRSSMASGSLSNERRPKSAPISDFKKQAKLLVRWHRERNYSVGGRIRQLSRYEDLTDIAALALPFPLNEAQEINCAGARLQQLGGTQARLEESTENYSASPSRVKADEGNARALCIGCAGKSDFYRDKLGFTIDFLHGQPAFYASVSRDEACIHLRFVHQPMYVAGLREKEQVIAAFLSVANVKGLFAEYQTRKVPFVHRLEKEPWGQSSFIVSDPDGNALSFAG